MNVSRIEPRPVESILGVHRARFICPSTPSEIFPFVPYEGDEDEQKDGERPQGRASVADERKRDADDRHEAHGHADVDEQVHEDAACDTVAVDAGEGLAALLRV